jgi:hypothetical protein
VDVVSLGAKIEQYQNNPEREVEKAALVFASGERNDDKSLRLITVEMTLSMGEKANLRKFLESWRGKAYTPDQVEEGVPLDRLAGQPALVSVQHVLTKAGNRFAKVVSIAQLPPAIPAPSAELLKEYERPPYFETKKAEYAKGVSAYRASVGVTAGGPDEQDDEDDDLPFDTGLTPFLDLGSQPSRGWSATAGSAPSSRERPA